MENDVNEQDILVTVKLPRKDYELMRKMIEREEAFTWLSSMIRASLIWVIAGGVLSVFLLWDQIHNLVMGK